MVSHALPVFVTVITGQATPAHSPQAHLISPQTATKINASPAAGTTAIQLCCRASLLCPPTTSQSLSPSHAESLDSLTPILDKASAPAAPGWEWLPSPIYSSVSPRRQPPDYVGPAISLSQNIIFIGSVFIYGFGLPHTLPFRCQHLSAFDLQPLLTPSRCRVQHGSVSATIAPQICGLYGSMAILLR